MQLGAPVVGGAGGEFRKTGCTEGPIVVDSDVDTEDDSGECEGEPDDSFTIGLTNHGATCIPMSLEKGA